MTLDGLQERLVLLIEQLELARSHVETMLEHLEARELARLGAHGFSVQGHMVQAAELLEDIAADWADHSEP